MTQNSLVEHAEHHRQEAYAAFDRNEFATARRSYEQALVFYDQILVQRPDRDIQLRIFYALRNLGVCALRLEDYAAARDAYERIFTFYLRQGALLQEEELHVSLLKAYIGLPDHEAAIIEMQRTRDFARLHDPQRQATLLWQLADIAVQIQHYDVAGDLFAVAYDVSERMAKGLEYQSRLLWAWGQFESTYRSRADGQALSRLSVLAAAQYIDDWRVDNRESRWRMGQGSWIEKQEQRLEALKQKLKDFTSDAQADQ